MLYKSDITNSNNLAKPNILMISFIRYEQHKKKNSSKCNCTCGTAVLLTGIHLATIQEASATPL